MRDLKDDLMKVQVLVLACQEIGQMDDILEQALEETGYLSI